MATDEDFAGEELEEEFQAEEDDEEEEDDDLEIDGLDDEFADDEVAPLAVVADDDEDDSDDDEDDDEAPAEEDEDDDEIDEDDEESLDVLLARDKGLDDEEILLAGDPKELAPTAPAGEGEFTCRSCFLVKRQAQLADSKKLICLDCA